MITNQLSSCYIDNEYVQLCSQCDMHLGVHFSDVGRQSNARVSYLMI